MFRKKKSLSKLEFSHERLNFSSVHTVKVTNASLSSNNLLALGSEDHIISLWDLILKNNSNLFNKHEKPITSLTFNLKGTILASGSEDLTTFLPSQGKSAVFFLRYS